MLTLGDGWSAAQWALGAWLLARIPTPSPTRAPAPGGRSGPDLAGPVARRVSVIVPARDEAASLPHLLASLATQTDPAAEVIVVDDGSTDDTAALAAATGATVVPAGEPPPGWAGKPWACHVGSEAASGDVLVFLDADVTLAPDAISRLTERAGQALLSVEPFHRTVRPYERLSAVCNLVSLMGSGAFTGPPRRPARVAFGPCLVVGRDDYRLLGGHAHPEVRGRVTEDLALAQRARTEGLAVTLLGGGRTVAFRMYPAGLRQLIEGWTKALASGARGAPVLAGVATFVWVWGALGAAGSGVHAVVGPHRLTSVVIYGAWAIECGWMLRRVGRFGWLTAVLFPVPLLAFVALFVRSAGLVLLRRPRRWRGRVVTGR